MMRGIRYIACALVLVLLGGMLSLATPAQAAAGGCELGGTSGGFGGMGGSGTVTLTPGVNAVDRPQALQISGLLSNCEGLAGTPATGSISMGNVFTSGGVDLPDGFRDFGWQEPAGTGNGSCANTTISGPAIVRWTGGDVSVVDMTEISILSGILIQGEAVSQLEVPAHDRYIHEGDPDHELSQPATLTLATTLLDGAIVQGGAAAWIASPAGMSCTNTSPSGPGLTTLSLNGGIGFSDAV